MQNISVLGLGYVGAVTAGCLASKGHHVLGVDTNTTKIAKIQAGRSPVLEPGLDELINESHAAGRLQATTDTASAVRDTNLTFLCVGTPSLRMGKLDLSSIERSCREAREALRS